MDTQLKKIPGVRLEFFSAHLRQRRRSGERRQGRTRSQNLWDRPKTLEAKGQRNTERHEKRFQASRTSAVSGTRQPNVNLEMDRAARRPLRNQRSRHPGCGRNRGGRQSGQPDLHGEQRYDLAVRYQEPYRKTIDDIANIRILAPSGERVSLGQFSRQGGRRRVQIYREGNSRYIAIKYSVRGRDLGSTVEQAIRRCGRKSNCPKAITSTGRASTRARSGANARLAVIVPITFCSFPHPVLRVRFVEMGRADSRGGRAGAARRILALC